MTKKIIVLTVVILSFISISACSLGRDNIYINGDVEETVEVGSAFVDKGVTFPENLTLITEGEIDTSKIGVQKLKYNIYSADGELVKELYRFVNVSDTVAPIYTASESKQYYAGFSYKLSDFISDYSDNYDSKSSIEVSQKDFVFTDGGQHTLNIEFKDSSGNIALYTATVNVVVDIEQLIYNVYQSQPSKVHSSTTSTNSKHIHVSIDEKTSLGYFDSGSLHYSQTVDTNLGIRASIQISSGYGEFDKASVTFHVSGNGEDYSVGFATIDATAVSVTIQGFLSDINNLDLDTNKMLEELNVNINQVLNDFRSYMDNVLHLELK